MNAAFGVISRHDQVGDCSPVLHFFLAVRIMFCCHDDAINPTDGASWTEVSSSWQQTSETVTVTPLYALFLM
jgi:hypothetical protein